MVRLLFVLFITVLFSTTPKTSPVREYSTAPQVASDRRYFVGNNTSVCVTAFCSIAVQLSPAPSRWAALEPQLHLTIAGSAPLSLDLSFKTDIPFMPELLNPVYIAKQLFCLAAILCLMGLTVILLSMVVWMICSYCVHSINPLHIKRTYNISQKTHSFSNQSEQRHCNEGE